nr:unnamed protein product [Callosobruchus analis]
MRPLVKGKGREVSGIRRKFNKNPKNPDLGSYVLTNVLRRKLCLPNYSKSRMLTDTKEYMTVVTCTGAPSIAVVPVMMERSSGTIRTPRPSNSGNPVPSTNNTAINCPNCSRPYVTKSGLAKHLLTCGKRDRSKCQFRKQEFSTYTGFGYMSKRHTRRKERNKKDSEIFTILANIEARAPKKSPFMSQMVKESGLTKDQVRHRREKPIYQEYLRLARTQLRKTP